MIQTVTSYKPKCPSQDPPCLVIAVNTANHNKRGKAPLSIPGMASEIVQHPETPQFHLAQRERWGSSFAINERGKSIVFSTCMTMLGIETCPDHPNILNA